MYVYVYVYISKKARNTIIHTYTLPIHRISLLYVGNFPDPIRYETKTFLFRSFGCSVCLLLSGGTEPRGLGLSSQTCLSDFFIWLIPPCSAPPSIPSNTVR